MISVLVNLVLVNAFECNKNKCPTFFLNNALNFDEMRCDLSCNTLACHLDILTDELREPLYKTFKLSDCYFGCFKTCDIELLMNDVCDSACNTVECGYDLGKCGYCSRYCKD
jgi:hypothetical protein